MTVLVTGASGNLGAYLIDALRLAGHGVVAWSGSVGGERSGVRLVPVDFEAPDWAGRLDEADPEAILHAAAIASAESVRRDPPRARAINVSATQAIARWASDRGRRLVFTSTDLVFDGSKPWNREDDPAEPVLEYGRTKKTGEAAIREVSGGLVVRLPLMFGPSRCGRPAFFDRAIAALGRGEPQTFFEDEFRTPLDYPTAAEGLVRLLESDVAGIVHLAGSERVSRFGLMARIASALGFDPSLVRKNRQSDAPSPEPRPADVSLDTSRLRGLLPGLPRPTIEAAIVAMASR